MELSRRDFKVMMLYDYNEAKGLHQEKSLENLKQCLGNNALLTTQVFSGLGNLDEAGRVMVMSTGTAHQWLLLLLQKSRQRKNDSGPNQGLPLERFRKVLASERSSSSQKTICKVDPLLVDRRARVEWFDFMWVQRFGCFRTSPNPQNSKNHSAHRTTALPVSLEN